MIKQEWLVSDVSEKDETRVVSRKLCNEISHDYSSTTHPRDAIL